MEYGHTAHNRSVYAPLPSVAPGFRSPRSFRYAPLPRLTPPTFLQPWPLLRKALIRAAKTSYTAGTLNAIKSGTFRIIAPHPCGARKKIIIMLSGYAAIHKRILVFL
jgi:hypothetical protein